MSMVKIFEEPSNAFFCENDEHEAKKRAFLGRSLLSGAIVAEPDRE